MLYAIEKTYKFSILFAFLAFGNVSIGSAQNSKIDSLKEKLNSAIIDTIQVDILYQLGYEYWDYDFEIALQYSIECLDLAKRLEYPTGLAKAYTNIGLYAYFKGDYTVAMENYHLGLEALDGKIYSDFRTYILTRIGNLYTAQSKFDSAFFYYDLSKKSIARNPNKIFLSSIFYNAGLAQIDLELFDSALVNLRKSLVLRRQLKDSFLVAKSIKEIGRYYLETNQYDSAQIYFNDLNKIYTQFDVLESKIFYNIYSGDLLFRKGDFIEALAHLKESQELLNKHEIVRFKVLNMYIMGQVLSEMGEYDKALEYLFSAHDLNVPLGNLKQEADINYELGYIYFLQNNPDAKKMVIKSRDQYEELGLNVSIASTNNILGSVHRRIKEYDSALHYFDLALSSNRLEKNQRGIAASLFNLSLVYIDNGELELALKNQIDALRIEQEIGNKIGEIISYNWLGQLHQSLGNIQKAEASLLQANKLLKLTPSLRHQEVNIRNLANFYSSTSNFQKAVQYFEASKLLSDSLFSSDMAAKSLQISSLRELEVKETEIKQLNNEKVTQHVKLDLQKSQLKQQQMLIIFTVITITFFIVFSYFLIVAIKALKKTQGKLIFSEKRAALGVLVAGLSHEINNPMNYIQGGVAYLKKYFKPLDEEQLEMLNSIEEGVKRSTHILNVLSHFESQQSYEYTECDLRQIIDKSVFVLAEETESNVEILIPEHEIPMGIHGNQDQLVQVFVEIIRNGLQAITGPGEILIECNSNELTYTIEITDTGQGIEPQDSTKIEDPFYTTKEPNIGKGLGLYISNFIMTEHQGSISYQAMALGTKVTLVFKKSA